MDQKENYKRYVSERAKRSPIVKNCVCAFLTGGFICCLGQGLRTLLTTAGVAEKDVSALVSVSLIFIAVVLTSCGIFDNIARFAGAGTLVPITGFANAVASPAIDSRGEGYILGVGAKIFTVAGPVILYGTLAGTVYGIVYWISSVI